MERKTGGNYYVWVLASGEKEERYEPVEGEPVVIEGLEELDLFLHHPYGGKNPDIWVISEGKTGAAITGWAGSPEEAKQSVEEILASRGVEAVRIAVSKRLEERQSPRYVKSGKE